MQRAAINRGITFTSLVKTNSFGVWLADIFSSLCDHDRDYFISPAQTPTSWTTSLFQRHYPANNLNLPENGSVTFSPLAWFIFSSGDFVVCTSSAYGGLFCHTTTDIRPAPVEIPTLFSQASLLLPTLCPLMNFLDCLSLHCSPPVLEAAEGFSHLASLYGCRLTPNSSICMCCHRDWWLKQQRRREGGREGGGVGVDAGEGRRGQQSKEARRWLRDFEALPPLVASLPVCVADNLLTPQRLIRHLCWSPLDLVTLRSWPGLKNASRWLACGPL